MALTSLPTSRPALYAILCATFLAVWSAACSHGSDGIASNRVAINVANQEQVTSTAMLAPELVLYFGQDLKTLLASSQSLAATPISKSTRSLPCAAGGEQTMEQAGSTVTVTFHDCGESEAYTSADGKTPFLSHTTRNGTTTWTTVELEGYEIAYHVHLDTRTGYEDSEHDRFTKVATLDFVYARGKAAYVMTDLFAEVSDSGRWYGQDYGYTLTARAFSLTRADDGTFQYTGTIGSRGSDYEGRPLMDGMADVTTIAPLAVDNSGGLNNGGLRVRGAPGTELVLRFEKSGLWSALNGGGEVFRDWHEEAAGSASGTSTPPVPRPEFRGQP
jgi:hypothetical protein